MVHRKKKPANKVNICQRFLAGSCGLGDIKCWYKHEQKKTGNDELSRIQCSNCEKVFETRFELMHHRKSLHYQEVTQCTKSLHGRCWFGAKTCWFHHEGIEQINENGRTDNIENKNNKEEIIEKIFNMMEVFTQRIMKLENDNQMTYNQKTI
jgi:hypothetical protein